jgi:hypothetical protein
VQWQGRHERVPRGHGLSFPEVIADMLNPIGPGRQEHVAEPTVPVPGVVLWGPRPLLHAERHGRLIVDQEEVVLEIFLPYVCSVFWFFVVAGV